MYGKLWCGEFTEARFEFRGKSVPRICFLRYRRISKEEYLQALTYLKQVVGPSERGAERCCLHMPETYVLLWWVLRRHDTLHLFTLSKAFQLPTTDKSKNWLSA